MALHKIDLKTVIASSLTRSQYEYFEMTGRAGFQEVAKTIPEKVLEVAVAQSCYQILRGSGAYVLQELLFSKFNDIIKESYGISNARKFEGDTRRIDIVIKDHGGKIICIIEIKRKISVTGGYQEGDLGRLREVRSYFEERAGAKLQALFAYPLTINFANEDEKNNEIENAHVYAKENFGNKYSIIVGDYWVKFPGENSYFCFAAVCGEV